MTRKEAVKLLQVTRLMLMDGANQPISDLYYALDMAIEALQDEVWKDTPKEQTMSRKEYKLPNGKIAAFEYDIFGIGKITLECMDELMDMIADRPQGEWIDEADKYDASFGIHDYRCSNCNSYADEYIGGHEWYTAGKPNFCPYCGADMRERKESE